jgi:CDP-diacylglycerol--glycerol-3-phosphate 3-phosphatidyltransferase
MVPYEFLQDHWVEAGCWLFASGFFDVLDGSLARNEKLQTPFGAFWDSTLDRMAEAVVFGGFVLYYARHLDETGILLSLAVFTFSLMVSYTRARAEGMGIDCEVGVLPRPGRILLLIGGLLVHQLALVLLLVGLLSLITVGQRVHRVWASLQTRKRR